jgi:hypothetical protein
LSSQAAGSKFVQETVLNFLSNEIKNSEKLDIKIANTRIRIHTTSQELRDFIYPALQWQADCSENNPDIEIFALDGPEAVKLPWSIEEYVEGNRLRGLESGTVLASFDIKYKILSIFDRNTNQGIFWTPSPDNLPEWEFGAPLRNILTWALIDSGLHLIHAAAVGKKGIGVLLCGLGGAGKSTTTALCLQNGFMTTGDDYCAISLSNSAKVYGIYGLLKLVPGSMGTANLSNPKGFRERSDGKMHYSIEASMCKSMAIGAIVFTQVGDFTKAITRLPPREGLLRLMSSTLSQATIPQNELFETMGGFSKAIKAFEFEVGSDIDNVRKTLDELCVQ